ncbi:MAG: acyl carrier protein phosphodiesterase [Pseudohaliea sp.]
MNYLAHALLAQPDAGALIGNLAGDHVKGPLAGQALHPRVAAGVRRHRRVDALTDAHPAYRSALRVFPAGERRYAGVALDIAFDYYLARHWSRYAEEPLEAFRQRVYRVLRTHDRWLPPAFAPLGRAWADAEWLRAYETRSGMEAVLARLARRRRRELPVAALIVTLAREDAALEAAFQVVFPAVRAAVAGSPGSLEDR